jgi:hypothetical protein
MSDDLIGTIWVGVRAGRTACLCVWRGDLDVTRGSRRPTIGCGPCDSAWRSWKVLLEGLRDAITVRVVRTAATQRRTDRDS